MKRQRTVWASIATGLLLTLSATSSIAPPASAVTSKSDAVGVQAILPSPPPTQAGTVTVPANGTVTSTMPITLSGLCVNGLLVKVFDNNVFIGSAMCAKGSYSIQANLFGGSNEIIVRMYDALDQAGPDSNKVNVTFNDGQFAQLGTHVSLRSDYALRGAAPGSELEWSIVLSDGTAPYAISVDWGDGTPNDLFTVESAGSLTLKHVYTSAGVYRVLVRATDKNGQAAFLQLVGQATGAIQSTTQPNASQVAQTKLLWWPSIAMMPLILAAFWLGRHHKLAEIIHKRRGLE